MGNRVTITVRAQDGSNQHEESVHFDLYEIAAMADVRERLSQTTINMLQRVIDLVDPGVRVED